MSVIFIVLPIALVVVLLAVVAFIWGARRGQFDDLETPALRMLHDDSPPPAPRAEDPPRLTVVRSPEPPAT
jgi:cbb3-type cytochrome oxidase maturation protein